MSTTYSKPANSLEAALCDCCDTRPGTGMIVAFGIETWICDVCRGVDDEPNDDHEEIPK